MTKEAKQLFLKEILRSKHKQGTPLPFDEHELKGYYLKLTKWKYTHSNYLPNELDDFKAMALEHRFNSKEDMDRFHRAALDLCTVTVEKTKFKSNKHTDAHSLGIMIKLGTEHQGDDQNHHPADAILENDRAEAFRVKKFKKVQFKIEHFKPNIAIDTKDIQIRFFGDPKDKIEYLIEYDKFN